MNRPLKKVNGKTKEMSDADMDDVFPLHYYSLLNSSGSLTDGDDGFYFLGNSLNAIPESTGNQYSINSIYLDSADFKLVAGNSPKLLISAEAFVNDTDTSCDFEVALYEIIRNSSYGSGTVVKYDTGILDKVTNSELLISNPIAGSKNQDKSVEFDFPSNGYYAIGVNITSGPVALNSTIHIIGHLKVKA